MLCCMFTLYNVCVQYRGVFSTVGGYHDAYGGYLNTVGDTQCRGGTSPSVLMKPSTVLKIYHDLPHGTAHTLYRVMLGDVFFVVDESENVQHKFLAIERPSLA